MKISYTIYDDNDEVILGGVCEFHELSDIQWNAFDNGHMVVAEVMDE